MAATISLLALLVLGGWAGLRVRGALAAYRDVRADVAALEATRPADLARLNEGDLAQIASDLARLQHDLRRLDAALTPPAGAALVERLPGIGPRYAAGRRLIRVVELLARAGRAAAEVTRETLIALQATGVRRAATATGPTWLEAVQAQQPELDAIVAQVEEARQLRASIDPQALPAAARARLSQLDRALALVAPLRAVTEELPLLAAALGGDGPARYLVLFQNPAELRLSGGFPGTVALVTLERGQVVAYTFHDIYALQQAYLAGRQTPVPAPWPLAHYFRHAELPIQDATWWADFSRGGAQLAAMYGATGWPPIDGVVGLTPAVVRDLLALTGPVTVEVDGAPRVITAANVDAEIERQRFVHGSNPAAETHKAVLALVGQALIERLTAADRGLLLEVARALRAAADRRDLQVYAVDPQLQAAVDARGWSGRLEPAPGTPTLALSAASLVTNKASRVVAPHLTLTVAPPHAGRRAVTLEVALAHTGDPSADPYHAGYQRWWLEVRLPAGSVRQDASHAPLPDPDAPNGGSYELELAPGQTTHFSLRFSMPDASQLLLRRQPGLTPVTVVATTPGCRAPLTATLTQDLTIDLATLCR